MIRTYLHFELKEGNSERLVDLFRHHRILETSVAQPGCHSAELTLSDNESRATVTATWDDPEAYARWTARLDRGRLAREISRLLAEPIDAATRGSTYRIAHQAVPLPEGAPHQQEEIRP